MKPLHMIACVAAVLLTALLAACADQAFDGEYTWKRSNVAGASRYEWYQVASPHKDAGCRSDSVGCAYVLGGHVSAVRTCLVYSYYTEADARKLFIGNSSISHFDHEVGPDSGNGLVNLAATKGHCAGNVHEERPEAK
mgnify:CR=1 FL=1